MSMYKGDTTVCTLLLCTVHVVMSSGRMSCSIDNQKCMCNETENVCVSIITRENYRFFSTCTCITCRVSADSRRYTQSCINDGSLPEISDAHYVFLTRHCKRPLIFRVRVH